MPATQISFASFARAQSLQAVSLCTLPTVAAHAPASVVADGGDSGGECTPRMRVRYVVDVRYPGAPVVSFRWPTAARARACARDFPHGVCVIRPVAGYLTFEGFVEVPPSPALVC